MDPSRIENLPLSELNAAYTYLRRAAKPLLSGAIDPLINLIDFSKLCKKIATKPYVSDREIAWVNEYVRIKKLLNQQKYTVG